MVSRGGPERYTLVHRNAAQGVKVSQAGKEEIMPLTPEQVGRLFMAARGDRLQALYVVAVATGLRQGELFALRWEDVDLDPGTLWVRHTMSSTEGGDPVFVTPKTAKSHRVFKLPAPAIEALERHRKAQEQSRRVPLWNSHGLVFCTTTGTPLDRHNLVRRSFKPLLEKAGLPPNTRFHDFRHTAATLLASRNVNPIIVQEVLGHASISITLGLYSHAFPGIKEQAASAMEDALS